MIDAPEKKEGSGNILSLFRPVPGYTVTPLLIDLNILIFLLMVISGVSILAPTGQELLNWGANFRPVTLEGQYWRLLTCCFLHIGLLHLLLNMYALVYIGLLLEPHLGKLRFITAYLCTGIASSVVSLWWHDQTVSAGASGAIFGMYGVFLAMLTSNLIEKGTRNSLLLSIGIFVGYNLLNGLKGGIDNAAHIGGLVSGLLTGYIFLPGLKKPGSVLSEKRSCGLVLLLVLVSSFLVIHPMGDAFVRYKKMLYAFSARERKALEIFNLPRDVTFIDSLSLIRSGLVYWDENIKLLNQADSLPIPAIYRTRDEKLRDYCRLRIQSYQLMYKAIDEHTDRYNEQIQANADEIIKLQDELKK